jgi:hypothetical protein
MDNRIAEIVEGRPPALDGKGQYTFRRFGRINQDPELNAYNDDLKGFDEEEGRDSATDDEGAPIQTKRVDAQPEEEEEEDEGQATMKPTGAASPQGQDAEEQTTGRQPKTSIRKRVATRQGRVSSSGVLASIKRRRKVGLYSSVVLVSEFDHTSFPKDARQLLEEPVLDDIDATLRGTEVGDNLVEEPEPSPIAPEQPNSSATAVEATQPETGRRQRGRPKLSRVVHPVSPRRTRTRSNPHDSTPAASQAITRAMARASVTTATVPEPIPESQVFDEFVANSDLDDEGEMHEVEANLHVSVGSRGVSLVTHLAILSYQPTLTPRLFFFIQGPH